MKKIILTFLLSIFSLSTIISQDLETEIELLYKKTGDQTAVLTAKIMDEDGAVPENASLLFFTTTDTLETSLGKSETDKYGFASLTLDNISKIFALTHSATFKASYEENEGYMASETEITIKDAVLSMEMEVIDSVNTISFQLSSWDEEGNLVGIEDGEIYVHVPRLFGQLQVAEAWTDEDGQDQTKFPEDIRGDENGLINVIARIDEHEEFGTLEISQDINWGIPLVIENGNSRSLTSSKTPLWMLISFIILIVAVWFHYGVILYNLRKINSMGDKEEEIIY